MSACLFAVAGTRVHAEGSTLGTRPCGPRAGGGSGAPQAPDVGAIWRREMSSRMVRMGEALLCVLCRTRPVDARWRPFCSERCRNEDLANWADGAYRLAGETVTIPDTDAGSDAD